MRAIVVTLLSLSMVNVMAMPQDMDGDGDKNPLAYMMMMMGGKMGKNRECPDPTPFATEIFTMMCDVDNCEVNAPKCMAAVMPPGNMCDHKRTCIPKVMGSMKTPPTKENRSEMKKMVMECVMTSIMASMGLEYVKGDNKLNALNMLTATLSEAPDFTEESRNLITSSVLDDICVPPGEGSDMMDKMRFCICIMKTCVTALADQ